MKGLRSIPALLRRLLCFNLPQAAVFALALALPDQLMNLHGAQNHAIYSAGILACFLLFGLAVSLIRPTRLVLGFLLVLGSFEIAHFCYMDYFGGLLDADAIIAALAEYRDVYEAGTAVARFLFLVPLFVAVPYAVGWLSHRSTARRRVTFPYAWLPIAMLGMVVPYHIVRDDNAVEYYAEATLPSPANSYLIFSTLLFNHLPKLLYRGALAPSQAAVAAASVSEMPVPARATVVVIMNESLTYDRMSLYGYRRNTTPQLDKLKADPQFAWKEGIAAGVGTNPTFHSFWNGIRDPRDELAYMTQATNLFRLARQHGFTTSFLSTQGGNLLRGTGTRFIQNLVTREAIEPLYEQLHDEVLGRLLQDIEPAARNFIVLHLRSAHAPYEHNYARRPELELFPTEDQPFKTFQRNAYDNAVRYNDFIIGGLLEQLRGTVSGPLYVFITSDHGQMMGDNPQHLFGHGVLVPEAAHVPIMLYQRGGDPEVLAAFRQLRRPTHYELACLILRVMGFRIIDPGAEPEVQYINGTGYYGSAGYIRISRDQRDPHRLHYEIVPG